MGPWSPWNERATSLDAWPAETPHFLPRNLSPENLKIISMCIATDPLSINGIWKVQRSRGTSVKMTHNPRTREPVTDLAKGIKTSTSQVRRARSVTPTPKGDLCPV